MTTKRSTKKKVGILTFHYSNNYGAVLQTYALLEVLTQIGVEPIILNRLVKNERHINILKHIKKAIREKYINRAFVDFRKKFLNLISPPVYQTEDFENIIKSIDAVIVGSDQVWRWEYVKTKGFNNFLDFVPDNVTKCSYAASFGINKFEESNEVINRIRYLLSRFKAISVREEEGIEICKDTFQAEAVMALDTTFLLKKNDYEIIINNYYQKTNLNSKYIATYFLDKNDSKIALTELIKSKFKLPIKNITKESKFSFNIFKGKMAQYIYPNVGAWLLGIKDAEFVITDSYHGVVFSLIFKKQFLCVGNESRGLSRFTSLLNLLGLIDRLILNANNINPNYIAGLVPVDYAKINKIIEIERSKSLSFLRESLNLAKNVTR